MKQLSYQTKKQVLVKGCPKMPLSISVIFNNEISKLYTKEKNLYEV